MADSKKYLMRIAYDGTRYSGWQIQPNSKSVQEIIEKALHTLLKAPVRIIGAGRTDAGVHALGQVAHFSLDADLDCDKMGYALNGMLPHDIRIKALVPTPETFHAQYSALSKEYHYHLWLEKIIDPFVRLYRHHLFHRRFSFSHLEDATSHFLGTHDFATFANVGGSVSSTVRTLTRLDIVPQEGGIRLEFEGNGFLYKMVRNIVGTLLEVAVGKRISSEIPELLSAKDRQRAGPAAPSRGLFLVKINYPPLFENNSRKEEKCINGLPVSSES
jgi:tRNA pseudouridine38-40 synthase